MSDDKETPRDQPQNVATQDAPRPPDNAVVTSDLPPEAESGEADAATQAAATDTKPDGTKEPPSAGDDDKPQKPRNRSAERRIKKLSSKLSRATDLTEQQRKEIAAKDAEIARLKAAQPKPVEPKLEDFQSPTEYGKAYSKWEKDVAAYTDPAADTDQQPTANPPPEKQTPADDPLADARNEFLESGREQLGDEFAEALEEEGTAVSQVMAEYIFESELGPAIYVHLANNVEDSQKIYDMSAPKAVKALEELEDRAKAGELDVEGQLQVAPAPGEEKPASKGSAPKNPGGTKAPTPPSTTKDGANLNTAPDPDNESMDEYAARRRKEEARRMGYDM